MHDRDLFYDYRPMTKKWMIFDDLSIELVPDAKIFHHQIYPFHMVILEDLNPIDDSAKVLDCMWSQLLQTVTSVFLSNLKVFHELDALV
jgi:hypothetical protein